MQNKQIESILIALRRVIRATDIHSRNLIKTTGMTAPQLLLLQAIDKQEKTGIGQLATEISLSQATVTSILDRLESRGYVLREKSGEDKRKVHTLLTEKGRLALNDAPDLLQENFVRKFTQLQDWEQNMIIASVQRIAQMMDAQDIDAAPMLEVGNLASQPSD
ncbi:MAG: MarR family transcriptional regulator [Pseudomonadales bacterium]|nr:MarR family transcriptional regulator [Pseudomonadales bacterium]